MVSELDTRRCASEEAEPQRGWTRGGVLAKMLDHIDWRRERVPARTLGTEGGGL